MRVAGNTKKGDGRRLHGFAEVSRQLNVQSALGLAAMLALVLILSGCAKNTEFSVETVDRAAPTDTPPGAAPHRTTPSQAPGPTALATPAPTEFGPAVPTERSTGAFAVPEAGAVPSFEAGRSVPAEAEEMATLEDVAPEATPVPTRPVPPTVSEEDVWWGDDDHTRLPGDDSGPVGPIGHTGETHLTYAVLPKLGDEDFAMWYDNRDRSWVRYLGDRESYHWRNRVDDEVYDLCDEADAMALAYGGRVIAPGEELSDSDHKKIQRIRNELGAWCIDSPWAPRYVAVAPAIESLYAPTEAHSTPEAAIAEVIERNNIWGTGPRIAEDYRRLPDSWGIWDRKGAGIYATGGHLEREFPLEATDRVVVSDMALNVEDGALRGLLHNQSKTLFARNVSVSAASADTGGKPVTGTWQWPLTMQPGEFAPFEITGWDGSSDPENIRFAVSYRLSEYLDLTRSFQLDGHTRTWTPQDIPPALLGELYPEDLVDGKVPLDYSREAFFPSWHFRAPDSHPSLRDLIIEFYQAGGDQLIDWFHADSQVPPNKGVGPFKLANVGQFKLRAYIAFTELKPGASGYASNDDALLRIVDVVDLSAYLYPVWRNSPQSFGIPLLSPNPTAFSEYVIWIGGANPEPAAGQS